MHKENSQLLTKPGIISWNIRNFLYITIYITYVARAWLAKIKILNFELHKKKVMRCRFPSSTYSHTHNKLCYILILPARTRIIPYEWEWVNDHNDFHFFPRMTIQILCKIRQPTTGCAFTASSLQSRKNHGHYWITLPSKYIEWFCASSMIWWSPSPIYECEDANYNTWHIV